MHNYLDSGSIENQSVQSQPIDHLDDTDYRAKRHPSDTDQTFRENRKQSLTTSILEENEQCNTQESAGVNEALIDFEAIAVNNQSISEVVDSKNSGAVQYENTQPDGGVVVSNPDNKEVSDSDNRAVEEHGAIPENNHSSETV